MNVENTPEKLLGQLCAMFGQRGPKDVQDHNDEFSELDHQRLNAILVRLGRLHKGQEQ